MDCWSDSGLCGEKVTWELLGEILFIDGEGEIEDYLPDHSIWEPLAWLVHSVVIGNGVTRIGNYAFWGFTALKEISIPWSVTEIGEGAFPNRERLVTDYQVYQGYDEEHEADADGVFHADVLFVFIANAGFVKQACRRPRDYSQHDKQ